MREWRTLNGRGPRMRERFAWLPVRLWVLGSRYREPSGRAFWLRRVVEVLTTTGEWVAFEHHQKDGAP